jgi:hypothetical protein
MKCACTDNLNATLQHCVRCDRYGASSCTLVLWSYANEAQSTKTSHINCSAVAKVGYNQVGTILLQL